jgi:Uncharacterized conserved protein (DUF2277)
MRSIGADPRLRAWLGLSFTTELIDNCRWSDMCRAIKTLHNFSPPATDDEIRASSLQFVPQAERFHETFQGKRGSFQSCRR